MSALVEMGERVVEDFIEAHYCIQGPFYEYFVFTDEVKVHVGA